MSRKGASATVVLICFGAFLALLILIGIVAGRGMVNQEHAAELSNRLASAHRDMKLKEAAGEPVVGASLAKEAEIIREFATQYSSSTFGKICYGYAMAYNQLLPAAQEYDRALAAFNKTGGWMTTTLKDSAAVGRRLAALPPMIKANREMATALKAFPEQVEVEIERAGVSRSKAKKELVASRLSERIGLHASIREIEAGMLEELQVQMRVLREYDGQWTSSNGRAYFASDVPAKAQQKYRDSLARLVNQAQRILGLIERFEDTMPEPRR